MLNHLIISSVILNITYISVLIYFHLAYLKLCNSLQEIKALVDIDNVKIAETVSRIDSLNSTLITKSVGSGYVPNELGVFLFNFGLSTILIIFFLISFYYALIFLGGYISLIPNIFASSQPSNISYGIKFIEGFDVFGNKIRCVIEGNKALISFIPEGALENVYFCVSDIGLVYSSYLKLQSGLISEQELFQIAEPLFKLVS